MKLFHVKNNRGIPFGTVINQVRTNDLAIIPSEYTLSMKYYIWIATLHSEMINTENVFPNISFCCTF